MNRSSAGQEPRHHRTSLTFATVLAGAVAGVLLAVTEAIWISAVLPSAVAPAGGPIAVFVALVPRGFVVGAGLGLAEALCVAAIQSVARFAGRRGGDEERCFAAIVGALLMVAIAALAQPLLRGGEGRFAHPILLALFVAAVAWCSYEIALLLSFVTGCNRGAGPDRQTATLRGSISAALLILAGIAYVADHVVLVKLYEPFHIALRLCAFVALQLSILAACLGHRAASLRAAPRWFGASFAIVTIGLTVGSLLGPRVPSATAITLVRLQGSVGGSLVGLTGSLIRTRLFSDGS